MSETVESPVVKLNNSKAFSDAFRLLKENAVLLIVSGILGVIVSALCFGILVFPMMMGMFAICNRLAAGDATKPVIGDLFKGFSFFIPGLVLFILAISGLLICGIGIIVTVPVALLGMLRVVDKDASIGEAIKFGFDVIFKQKQWMFIVLAIVAGVLGQLGCVICCVGYFVTLPLYFAAIACGYRQLCPKA